MLVVGRLYRVYRPAKHIGYGFDFNFGNDRNGLSGSSTIVQLGRFLLGGAFGVVTRVVGGVTMTFELCFLTGVVVVGDIEFSLILAFFMEAKDGVVVFCDIELSLLWASAASAFCIAVEEGVAVSGDVGISLLWAFCMAADGWGMRLLVINTITITARASKAFEPKMLSLTVAISFSLYISFSAAH